MTEYISCSNLESEGTASMIFFSMENALVKVDEKQQSAKIVLHGLQPVSLAFDPFHPELLYCGTYSRGLWRSRDAGENWEPIGSASAMGPLTDDVIPHQHIMSLMVSTKKTKDGYGTVYAGTEPSAVFSSEDCGETWTEFTAIQSLPSKPLWSFPPRPHTSHVRFLGYSPEHEDQLFAAIEFGAFIRSLDGGTHWEDRKFNGPLDTHTFALHPKDSGRIYAAAGDGYFQHGRGYAESRDSGSTWSYPDEGLHHHYLYTLAVDSGDPDIVLAGAADSPANAHFVSKANSAVYRKEGDKPWKQVRSGLPESDGTLIPTLAAHPSKPGTFFALCNRGLYQSDDTGLTWHKLDILWNREFEKQHPHVLAIIPE